MGVFGDHFSKPKLIQAVETEIGEMRRFLSGDELKTYADTKLSAAKELLDRPSPWKVFIGVTAATALVGVALFGIPAVIGLAVQAAGSYIVPSSLAGALLSLPFAAGAGATLMSPLVGAFAAVSTSIENDSKRNAERQEMSASMQRVASIRAGQKPNKIA